MGCEDDPCENGGACVGDGDGGLATCLCPAGFAGTHCERVIDACASAPCVNGGTCTAVDDGYVCECPLRFTGPRCETRVDACEQDSCENGGTCIDLASGPFCTCPPGFTGERCEHDADDCDPNPCANGGTCTDEVAGFSCACPAGFAGPRCETNLDECADAPCENGGICIDRVDGYFCACPAGYDGPRCEVDVDDCDPDPCLNGGTCTDAVAGFSCACPDTWHGERCELDVDECLASPCEHGSLCVNRAGSFECILCSPPYLGARCELAARIAVSHVGGGVDPRPTVAAASDSGAFVLRPWLATGHLETHYGASTEVPGSSGTLVARLGVGGQMLAHDLIAGAVGQEDALAATNDGAVVRLTASGNITIGAGSAQPIAVPLAGSDHLVVARYADDLTPNWATSAWSTGAVGTGAVAVGADGDIAVTAAFTGTLTFAPGRTDENAVTRPAEVSGATAVARLNADGTVAWVRLVTGTSWAYVQQVQVLSGGAVVVAGYAAGDGTVQGGSNPDATFTAVDIDDGFVARFSPDGDLVHFTLLSGSGRELPYSLSCTAEGRCVLFGSATSGSVSVEADGHDAHVIPDFTPPASGGIRFAFELASDGHVLWSDALTFASGSFLNIGGVARLPDGAIVAAAALYGTTYANPGSASPIELEAPGTPSLVLLKWSAEGVLENALVTGGNASVAAYGIDTRADGSILLSGNVTGTAQILDAPSLTGTGWTLELGSDLQWSW